MHSVTCDQYLVGTEKLLSLLGESFAKPNKTFVVLLFYLYLFLKLKYNSLFSFSSFMAEFAMGPIGYIVSV